MPLIATREAFEQLRKGTSEAGAVFLVTVKSKCCQEAKELWETQWADVAPMDILELP